MAADTSTSRDQANLLAAEQDKAWVAWSSGKDCLWALHLARQSYELEIAGLLTTVTQTYGRVSMHGVREVLLQSQADALGLPLRRLLIPAQCSEEVYDALMRRTLEQALELGIRKIIFGDIFLAGVRAYRERRMAEIGMEPLFPLWGRDTGSLAREMIEAGVRAYVTCLDPRKLPRDLAGRSFTSEFLERLPEGVDALGENGEFHTFAWDGPGYAYPIPISVGQTLEREGFIFTDLLPAPAPQQPGRRQRE